ncbi:SGNH/GDSL hydrolase family protein, partial [Klebsiella pneumoniae]|nr:SGNH/GDSL hydrolase family protein [Klebsiella pneumoniae]
MNKKAVLVLVVFVLFVASIVSGKLYWNKKVANATGQKSEVTKTKAEVKDSGAKKEEKKQDAKPSFN